MTVWVVIERHEATGVSFLLAVFSTEERARQTPETGPWKVEVIKCQVDPL